MNRSIFNKKIIIFFTLSLFSSSFYSQCPSLILNSSFEDNSCCPTTFSQLTCADNWVDASGGSSDYYNTCGGWTSSSFAGYNDPDLPAPAGDGYAGFHSSWGYKEYLGACLTSPMVAGTPYFLTLWIAQSNVANNIDLTLFGTPNCTELPWVGSSCPVGSGSWQFLADQSLTISPGGAWTQITLSFTPTVNINAIALGGPCAMSTGTNYYFVDDLILNDGLPCPPLPIDLLKFNVECQGTNTLLSWTTASEINNDYFTIERSIDAFNFEAIATVNGNGNSSTQINYSWTDDNTINGTAYYRLKQTDFNGTYEYFGMKSANCEQSSDISIYPNPFKNSFTISLSENTTYPTKVEVMDYLGRKVYTQTVELQSVEITLDELPSGTYFVKVFNETTQVVERMVKMK